MSRMPQECWFILAIGVVLTLSLCGYMLVKSYSVDKCMRAGGKVLECEKAFD